MMSNGLKMSLLRSGLTLVGPPCHSSDMSGRLTMESLPTRHLLTLETNMQLTVDGMKEVFFRNIFSVIQDSSRIYRWKTDLQIYMISAHCDDFPVFVSAAPIWQPLTHIIFWFAMLVGTWLGLRPWYDEYTPPRLRAVAASAGGPVNDAERKEL
jgi:hypothetical protein